MNFDEEPEGDPHGECAEEIRQLRTEVEELILERNAAWAEKKRNGERARSAELQLGAARDALFAEIRGIPCGDDCFGGHYRSCRGCTTRAKIALGINPEGSIYNYKEKHITNDLRRQQTEKDWWGWGWKELSGKTSEQLETQAKKVAATYKWSLPKERVIELLLSGKH